MCLDNHSTHVTPKIQAWAEAHGVELAYTPTNASWLNPIEPHFNPLKELALRNTYCQDRKEQARDVRRCIIWRNQHVDHPLLKAFEKGE